jgi:hypothetical protein
MRAKGSKRKAQPEQMTFAPHQIAEAPWAMLCLSPCRRLAMDRISHQKRPRQHATNTSELKRKRSEINEAN